jgi:hypothetical protein
MVDEVHRDELTRSSRIGSRVHDRVPLHACPNDRRLHSGTLAILAAGRHVQRFVEVSAHGAPRPAVACFVISGAGARGAALGPTGSIFSSRQRTVSAASEVLPNRGVAMAGRAPEEAPNEAL